MLFYDFILLRITPIEIRERSLFSRIDCMMRVCVIGIKNIVNVTSEFYLQYFLKFYFSNIIRLIKFILSRHKNIKIT